LIHDQKKKIMFIFSCAHLTCSRLHRFFLRLLKLALVPLDILLMFWGQPLDLWSLGHHMRTRCRLLFDHLGGSKIERLLFDFEIDVKPEHSRMGGNRRTRFGGGTVAEEVIESLAAELLQVVHRNELGRIPDGIVDHRRPLNRKY
jgi:hypothetical protein